MNAKVRFIDADSRAKAVEFLQDVLQKFESGELLSYTLAARYADGSMHSINSKCADLFDDLALATYHAHRIARRMELETVPT